MHIPTIGPRERSNPAMQMAISIMQLVVLSFGVAAVFGTLGRKDAILERQMQDVSELRSIASDLVKAQVLGASNDSKHAEMINALSVRMDRLESRR